MKATDEGKKPNFIEWYLKAAGKSEVPYKYHLWSAISTVASCLGNRVWFEKWKPGSKMFPNLYVFLIGPSAGGKDTSINFAYDIAVRVPGLMLKRAKLTGPALVDMFGHRLDAETSDEEMTMAKDAEVDQPAVSLIMPELSQSVGEGPVAVDFIKRMTAYYGGEPYDLDEGTRTNGRFFFRQPVFNWLAGSTLTWMMESVPRSAIEGGFLGRVCSARTDYDLSKRFPKPIFPPDHKQIMEWLIHRCIEITKLEGQFRMTNEARELHDHWYDHRPAPEDSALIPTWKRADDTIYKLSMVMSAAAGYDDKIIRAKNWDDARKLWMMSYKAVPELIKKASHTMATAQLEIVENYIHEAGVIARQSLTKKCSNRGIRAGDLDGYVKALMQQGDIKVITLKKGIAYEWVTGKGLMT